VSDLIEVSPRGRRLKGLDEFETPEFVGRMARVERRRKLVWLGTLASTVIAGLMVGLVL
jgi:hypothetical protein